MIFFCSFVRFSFFLIDPLVVAVATHKNQRKAVALCGITHEKDGLVVPTVGTVGVLRSRQRRIVADGAGNGVQDVSHLLLQIEPVDEGHAGCELRVPTEPARVLQLSVPLVFL